MDYECTIKLYCILHNLIYRCPIILTLWILVGFSLKRLKVEFKIRGT